MIRNSKAVIYWLTAGIVTLAFILLLGFGARQTEANAKVFTVKPLTDASLEEIGQAALLYTEAYYPSLSGSAEVVRAQSVKMADLPSLGLGNYDFASIEEPPVALVIVKGDFDVSQMLGLRSQRSRTEQQAHYIGYVLDLWAGVPALTITSPEGGAFRKIIDDGTIPAVTADAPIEPAPSGSLPVKKTLHYGETAPPVATSTAVP